jgi:hypothetical protein
MASTMSNIRLHYLYRDGSNYKKLGSIVFQDPDDFSIESIQRQLQSAFSEDGLFIAHQVRVPEIFLASDDRLTSDDHCFHEFSAVEKTSDAPNDPYHRSISNFLAEVSKEAARGWQAFSPQDRLSH